MNYTCFSGGADGADMTFEKEAIKYGVNIIAYSFYGHNTKSKNNLQLTPTQLNEGFEHIKIANKSLKRNIYMLSPYVKNLLSRNWFQVKNTDAIFAVGTLKNPYEVNGGTGWAIQEGIDNNKTIYVFEQEKNAWFEYIYGGDTLNDRFAVNGRFEQIDYIPPLSEKFTGIGTRDLNENGKNAIINLFKNSFID